VGASNSTGTIAWFESIASNPTLQITSPNGGENWEVGSIHPLTWNHTGTINNVKLEFSSDGGSTWSTIVSSTPNDGSYNWTVPNAISNNCLVRVADATDGRPSDTSNGRFSIIPPPPPSAPTITSFMPNSGPVGTVVTITGSHFTGVTGVAFNGTAAAFTVMSDTEIRATVPAGTTTGKISVTSAAGIGTSTADFIVTTAGGNTVTFTPTDDAFVRFSTPADNFGSADKLRARKTSSDELNTYFKFSVSGLAGAVQSAKLCLYVAEGSVNGGSIYVVANNYLGTNTPWVESGLLWTNAPAITGSPLSSLGAVEIGQTAEFEVTAAITGNGIYSFGLKNGSPDLLEYSSKEGRNAPQLIIQTAALSMPPTITSFASTSGPVGTEVTIEGTGFTGVSVVAFNGTPATIFSVDSDTRLRALVPVDATTGKISVTNAGGTGVSAENFVVTTSEGPSTVTFNPTDDAFVRSSTPTSNFGALSNLQLRKTASLESITYLKFNVTGLSGNVQSAKLRLKVTDSSPDGGSIYTVSNNYLGTNTPWRESGLKWNNAPTITGSPVSVAGAAGLGQMVEFDVTTAITGNGVYSFVLKIRSADLLKYSSKEGADAPQLVIDTASVIAAVAKDEDLGSDFTNREDHRPAASIPGRMTLYPNHPNPFNAQTMIEYVLPEAAKVRLVIFDIAGRSLRRLVDGMQPAGYQRVVWDGRDERNVVVSSGTYFYRLEVGSETHVNKMTVVK
jgi:flagellar hook assembly protein FlgD